MASEVRVPARLRIWDPALTDEGKIGSAHHVGIGGELEAAFDVDAAKAVGPDVRDEGGSEFYGNTAVRQARRLADDENTADESRPT
jgi:hypothetical protein